MSLDLDPDAPLCILCKEGESDQAKLKLYTNNSVYSRLVKSLKVIKHFNLRQGNFNTLILPAKIAKDDELYYHSYCHHDITKINKKFLDEYEEYLSAITNSISDDDESQHDSSDEVSHGKSGKDDDPDYQDVSADEQPLFSESEDEEDDPNANVEVLLENESVLLAQKVCVVCDKYASSSKKLIVSKSRLVYSNLKRESKKHGHAMLLAKLKIFKREKKFPAYHKTCYSAVIFFNKEKTATDNNTRRELKRDVISTIDQFIDREIVGFKKCIKLSQLTEEFKRLLQASYEKHNFSLDKNYRYKSNLRNHILKNYKNQIKFHTIENEEFLSREDAVVYNSKKEALLEEAYKTVAMDIRESCLNVPVEKLPLLSTQNYVAGECTELPKNIKQFFTDILVGDTRKQANSEKNRKLANSLTRNLVNNVNSGKVNASKQIEVGVVLKSTTGSRKVLNVVNKLGQTYSYDIIESIEPALVTNNSHSDTRICIPEIVFEPEPMACVEFTNFDNGATAEKETVEIIPQICLPQNESESSMFQQETSNAVNEEVDNTDSH
ncbi:uncharacterized protein LOC106643077 [Copidosoma floridanum]|uniref:uncharacterized protein LOC106643077 n=1 Tax=Copidosoma floridanum TaxID=29053 RepID=UPI0006C97468|nr:uncharacterized protein LOC106643077 [Copidosoma floridanum]